MTEAWRKMFNDKGLKKRTDAFDWLDDVPHPPECKEGSHEDTILLPTVA